MPRPTMRATCDTQPFRARFEPIASAVDLARKIGPRGLAVAVVHRAWSTSVSAGLACELSAIPPARAPKVAVTMRPEAAGTFKGFHDELMRVSGDDFVEVMQRVRMCDAAVPGLHVAYDPEGQPMYAQWLIDSTNQAALHSISHGLFPNLGPGEALVEGAYTFVAFRRLGIMAEGMRQLLVKAAMQRGATRCFTYVASANVPSLRGCANAGFDLHHVRVSRQRAGHKRNRRRSPSAADRAQWQLATQPKLAKPPAAQTGPG